MEWRQIRGYNGLYEISSDGDVRSLDRTVTCKNGTLKHLRGKILRKGEISGGYSTVALSIGGKPKSMLVHRLVCTAFIDNPLLKTDVNHINCNKSDNRVINLEWATRSENVKHSYKNGLNPTIAPVFEYDLDGNFIREYESISSAARSKLVTATSIYNACIGKSKRSSGSQWRYKSSNKKVGRIKRHPKGVSVVMVGDGMQRIYDSIIEAEEDTGINKESIFNVCNNKSKSAGGFSWKYLITKNK